MSRREPADLRLTSEIGFARRQASPGRHDDAADDLVGGGHVGIEPGLQRRPHEPLNGRRHLGIIEPLLRLPLEHRLADEDGKDADDSLANVLGGNGKPLGVDLVRLHVVADRLDDGPLEAALVRAAGSGADAVDVGTNHLVGRLGPLQGDFHFVAVAARQTEGSLGDGRLLALGDQPGQEFGDAAGMGEVLSLARHLVLEDDLQPGMDIRHVLQVLRGCRRR